MTQAQLLELVRARPFTVFTPDGREARVDHPEFIAYRGGRVAAVVLDDERAVQIDTFLVARIEVDRPTVAAAGPG